MTGVKKFKKSLYGRPSTVKTKLSLFENHIEPFTYASSLDGFINLCTEDWRDKALSLQTVKMCFTLLNQFVKFSTGSSIDTKRLYNQYFGDVPKKPAKLKLWTKEQIQTALAWAQANDFGLYRMMVVALNTGIRRGELLALTWEDIDFLNGNININKSRNAITRAIGPTKTNTPRLVQMNTEVEKIFDMGYTPGNEIEFCFPCVDPGIRLHRLCKATNLPTINWHDLRHTFATTLLESKVSPKWVSSQLGHAKLSTTLDIYWQCFNERVNTDNLYN